MNHFILHLRMSQMSQLFMTLMLIILTVVTRAQPNSDSPLLQYLYPDFSKAVVKMKNGQTRTAEMNYNMLTGNMVYKQEGKLYDLLNTEMIDTVVLYNSRFVRFGKAFYEVVVTEPLSLFIHHKGDLVPAGKPAGYGGTSQTSSVTSLSGISTGVGYYNLELPPDVIVKVDRIFWIRRNNEMFSFINKNQFLKIFPDKEGDLKEYMKKNRIKMESKVDLVKLMDYCNNIIAGE